MPVNQMRLAGLTGKRQGLPTRFLDLQGARLGYPESQIPTRAGLLRNYLKTTYCLCRRVHSTTKQVMTHILPFYSAIFVRC